MSNQRQATSAAHGGWIAGLAILSLGMPLLAVWLSRAASNILAQAVGATDYRAAVAALAVGVAGGIVTLLGSRAVLPAWLRWAVVAMASVALLISAYLLWTLIGQCGLQVVWGVCRP